MHKTRGIVPARLLFVFALAALFFVSNYDQQLLSLFVPTVVAKTTTKHVNASLIPADVPTSGSSRIDELIFRAGARYGVDPRLLHAVVWQESKYNSTARSHAGAQGLMQLMPATADRFNCRNALDPAANVEAGTKYLRWLLERFEGDVSLALAGYNAGEGNVDKYSGVPPFNETQNYVRIITGRYGSKYHPILTPAEARLNFNLVTQLEEVARTN